MPFLRSDAITGTVYVIAPDAEQAKARVFESDTYYIFEDRDKADSALSDEYRYTSGDARVYSVSLDVRVTAGG